MFSECKDCKGIEGCKMRFVIVFLIVVLMVGCVNIERFSWCYEIGEEFGWFDL